MSHRLKLIPLNAQKGAGVRSCLSELLADQQSVTELLMLVKVKDSLTELGG